MATMKVTNVVDRGSFIEVLQGNQRPCEDEVDRTAYQVECRALVHYRLVGVEPLVEPAAHSRGRDSVEEVDDVERKPHGKRAIPEEPNISSPSRLLPSPISVFVTAWAFFDVASAATIITPAPTRNHTGVCEGPFSTPVEMA